ncbi:MAG: TonB family protein [Methylophaga sp.]|uniref:energy transducer TonB n=1 Tax=unclassified Methylophaga TaxID=2629249 RepID=UPI0025F8865B|nr:MULTISPECIES: energy transducer TonB [unclassified Methylophaga]MDX1751156.1 TonB family protein [Methylophaga sp.]
MSQLLLNETSRGESPSMRIFIGLLLAILVNYGLFTLMKEMTTSDSSLYRDDNEMLVLDFVRLKQEETQPETIKREIPKKPPPPEEPPPPTPTTAPKMTQPDVQQPQMDMPKIDIPLNIAGQPYLGDFSAEPAPAPSPTPVQGPQMDDEVVPLVRIPPNYPRVAQRRGIEGVVTVVFTITRDGRVKDPEVVSASPENVFDNAAKTAILKWKFKPKVVDGEPVERRATQEIEFKLAR